MQHSIVIEMKQFCHETVAKVNSLIMQDEGIHISILGNQMIPPWRFGIILRGTDKFFRTFISFFRSFISFFRSFISHLGGEFSFPRELLSKIFGRDWYRQ